MVSGSATSVARSRFSQSRGAVPETDLRDKRQPFFLASGQTSHVPDELEPGLYERLIDEELARRLSLVDVDLLDIDGLRPPEAADRIAHFIADQLRSALGSVPRKNESKSASPSLGGSLT